MCDDNKFPPTPSKKYVNLAVVNHTPRDIDKVMQYTLHGNVEQLLESKEKMSIEDILKPIDHRRLRLVLIEGPPGVGKSTLAWELCRKWDKLSHMRQYSLVVLLRLREKYVQQAKAVADLFYHVNSDLLQSVAKEIVGSEGKGVLFILDGFDELPGELQRDGLLIDFITGRALPKSTVIVTSRPSATAKLLTKCCSQVQKRVEILGFTQECVKKYASTVFSSEPKLLDDFLIYISAFNNPAINSLMYIPLNAAIVVEVYRNSRRTGCPIPKTLTQLYTQLCLILLQRYLQNQSNCSYSLSKFVDLTDEYYQHFLQLSQIAFEGLNKNQVIFLASDLPRDLIHFGFLDVVSSIYNAGGDSHNFLHFTVQEFLVAYHIFQLPHHGILEVFKKYGSDKRWNVVWRFLSGLTGFEHFKGVINSEAFITLKDNEINLSHLLIQCIYEAQITEFDFLESTFKNSKYYLSATASSPLEKFALGYCIASSAPTASWNIHLIGESSNSFVWGLKWRLPCNGIVHRIIVCGCTCITFIWDCPTSFLRSITSLVIYNCTMKGPGGYYLAKLIPSMDCLSTLAIQSVYYDLQLASDHISEILNQLPHSKVSSLSLGHLSLTNTGNFLSLLAKAIHPSFGILKVLKLSTIEGFGIVDEILDLCFNHSSLEELHICWDRCTPLDKSFALLETNTCLTHLTIWYFESFKYKHIFERILQKNSTLKCITLKGIIPRRECTLADPRVTHSTDNSLPAFYKS